MTSKHALSHIEDEFLRLWEHYHYSTPEDAKKILTWVAKEVEKLYGKSQR